MREGSPGWTTLRLDKFFHVSLTVTLSRRASKEDINGTKKFNVLYNFFLQLYNFINLIFVDTVMNPPSCFKVLDPHKVTLICRGCNNTRYIQYSNPTSVFDHECTKSNYDHNNSDVQVDRNNNLVHLFSTNYYSGQTKANGIK